MDILAHALWTNAGAQGANGLAKKRNKTFHISVGWTAFWGIFPDVFAFSIPFAFRFYNILINGNSLSTFFMRPAVAGPEEFLSGFGLSHVLYNYSHSLVIWALVFVLIALLYKRPRYELLGWALHILIDIPSHTLAFFPTPFLFPISSYTFPYGVSWANQWYMIINYGALLVVWMKILLSKLKAKI